MERSKIAFVSVARSDYSIIKPVLQEFKRSREVEVSIILSGMHLSPEFGSTENDVIRDGWMPEARIWISHWKRPVLSV